MALRYPDTIPSGRGWILSLLFVALACGGETTAEEGSSGKLKGQGGAQTAGQGGATERPFPENTGGSFPQSAGGSFPQSAGGSFPQSAGGSSQGGGGSSQGGGSPGAGNNAGGEGPGGELCDGVDNDGDGQVDEGCALGCGDGKCNGEETCSSCPGDCGECLPSCPDGTCNGVETCSSCPVDCGACLPSCPDGTCNGSETCSSCPVDCGACLPACGDGACNGSETCSSCPGDCGPCTITLNDGTDECHCYKCPSSHPYPVGCNLSFNNKEPDATSCIVQKGSHVWVQEGQLCQEGGYSGTITCSKIPGNFQGNCKYKSSEKVQFSATSYCAEKTGYKNCF